MKAPSAFPLKRIALAIAVSLLGHSLLLWQWPKIAPVDNTELLPLQAKLEALPKPAREPVQPKAKPATPAQPASKPVAATSQAAASDISASAAAAASAVAATATPEAFAANVSRPALPRHAQLTFAVQYSSGDFKVGEVKHMLEIKDGQYDLRAETQTTGIASIFKSFNLRQSSAGFLTGEGLRPERYEENRNDGGSKQTIKADFDWNINQIHFSGGTSKLLLQGAQDILSLPYQLSQLPLNLETFPIALSNGKSIHQYFIAVGEETTISTAMGDLRTIPLRKVQSPNEDGLIIWLALEYRLLPVKMLYLDKSGAVSANMVITDIRVSDE